MRHQNGIAGKVQKIGQHLCEFRLIRQHLVGYFVYLARFLRHRFFGIYQNIVTRNNAGAVEFDAAYFHDPFFFCLYAGRFGIEGGKDRLIVHRADPFIRRH